ncbi:MAG: homoserine O-acetyltransferase [Bacteroidota bacterium]|nr:homoserine O-acetyltransferase [Bacteroidota bacterium]
MKKVVVENYLLDCGEVLSKAEFAYHTYGNLNADRSNAVLVFHALTGNSDAADWWDGIIGKGKPIDPKKHFIICSNFLGSCYGSTGPESINAETGTPYHARFPAITIGDIARQHLCILDTLGVANVAIGIGGSMGGLVLLELATLAPGLFNKIIAISIGSSHSAWRIAFSSVIRKTIEEFGETAGEIGFKQGLHLARQIAMTTYRSSAEFDGRFARDRSEHIFEIERYLEHQGEKIVARFSPHSYITLTKAMELYDISDSVGGIASNALFIGATSDILYSEEEIKETASKISKATYQSLDAPFGHDSFLVAQEKLADLIRPFIKEKQKQEIFA